MIARRGGRIESARGTWQRSPDLYGRNWAPSHLEGFEEAANFGVGPVLGSNELAANDTLTVDHVSLRPHLGTEELGDRLFWIADGDQVEVATVDKSSVFVWILVDADADHCQVGPVVVELEERRRLLDAGSAPGSPKIQQDHFAAIVGQVDGGASVRDGEIGCRGGELGRMSAAVARGE